MRWLQVELTLSGELAEPVAELLSRYATGGIAISKAGDVSEEPGPEAAVSVRAFLPVDPHLPTQRRKVEEGLWHLSQIHPLPSPSFQFIEEANWAEAWKAHYAPIPIGQELLVQPAWHDLPASGRKVVRLDPGMAFGTGTHPTTQHCLTLLEEHLRADDIFVDLGSGSGILSIAAVKLGARQTYAYDTAEAALEAGRKNARLNGVLRQIEFCHGSLEEFLVTASAGLEPDIIVVNILASVITGMLEAGLPSALPPQRILILSGILADQVPPILALAEGAGLSLLDQLADEDWRTLLLKKNPSL